MHLGDTSIKSDLQKEKKRVVKWLCKCLQNKCFQLLLKSCDGLSSSGGDWQQRRK